jgi:hypothetical protein
VVLAKNEPVIITASGPKNGDKSLGIDSIEDRVGILVGFEMNSNRLTTPIDIALFFIVPNIDPQGLGIVIEPTLARFPL